MADGKPTDKSFTELYEEGAVFMVDNDDILTPEELQNREEFLRWKMAQPALYDPMNDEEYGHYEGDVYIPSEEDERLFREDMTDPHIWGEPNPEENRDEYGTDISEDEIPF